MYLLLFHFFYFHFSLLGGEVHWQGGVATKHEFLISPEYADPVSCPWSQIIFSRQETAGLAEPSAGRLRRQRRGRGVRGRGGRRAATARRRELHLRLPVGDRQQQEVLWKLAGWPPLAALQPGPFTGLFSASPLPQGPTGNRKWIAFLSASKRSFDGQAYACHCCLIPPAGPTLVPLPSPRPGGRWCSSGPWVPRGGPSPSIGHSRATAPPPGSVLGSEACILHAHPLAGCLQCVSLAMFPPPPAALRAALERVCPSRRHSSWFPQAVPAACAPFRRPQSGCPQGGHPPGTVAQARPHSSGAKRLFDIVWCLGFVVGLQRPYIPAFVHLGKGAGINSRKINKDF